ncbi:carbon monoxide dehydrogenase D protein [Halarchaeum acidiphilum MH1-52-1]|uniref:Carbon monoxide dehydrogenase D protein n=2 Tax=Halarchaeum acidiphilum TaxID=489138 RepID=U2YVL0_9EURY|nr:MoxR family ATPase [Halarchaeum acidiphilum]GAD53065.1 carbon monoxide dehydrogenase D protein [Halarchaeum acidiphilum MH1-52-1]
MTAFADATEADVRAAFDEQDYVAGDDVVTTALLALRLGKPLLVEGAPGAGKTELAKTLARGFGTDLVRLQCYEGLSAENALYEWNYTKQLLAVEGEDASVDGNGDHSVFDEEFLLERPLLRALADADDGENPPVLLIDEVDRADEAFEALLLEVLSDFQISVPELGTVSAERPPIVVLTSNRTRALSDALKRRCLYLHVEPPSFERELEIVERKSALDTDVAAEVCGVVQALRERALRKRPGVAETLDWADALAALGSETLDATTVERTLGCLLKDATDVEEIDADAIESALADARAETRTA